MTSLCVSSRSTTWNATCEVGRIKRHPNLLRVVLAFVFIQYVLICCIVVQCPHVEYIPQVQ